MARILSEGLRVNRAEDVLVEREVEPPPTSFPRAPARDTVGYPRPIPTNDFHRTLIRPCTDGDGGSTDAVSYSSQLLDAGILTRQVQVLLNYPQLLPL